MPQEYQCHENRNLSTCSLSPWSRIMCAQSWQSINTEGGKEGRKEVCMGKIIQNNDSENRAYTAEEVYSVDVMKRKYNFYVGKAYSECLREILIWRIESVYQKVSFTWSLFDSAYIVMPTTDTSRLPALPAMGQRPFSSCTFQNHLIWSLHEGQEIFISTLTITWLLMLFPLSPLTTSLWLKAPLQDWQQQSQEDLSALSSPSLARPPPFPYHHVPSVTRCSHSAGFLLSATSMLQQQVFSCSSIRLVASWHPKLVGTAISQFHWSSCLESTRLPVKFFRVAIRRPLDHWSYGFLFLKSKFTMVHNELNYVSSVSLSNLILTRFP